MSINPIEALGGFTPMVARVLPTAPNLPVGGADATTGVAGAAGADFGQILSQGIENLQGLHDRADSLAVEAVKSIGLNRIDDIVVLGADGRPVGLVDTQDFARLKII